MKTYKLNTPQTITEEYFWGWIAREIRDNFHPNENILVKIIELKHPDLLANVPIEDYANEVLAKVVTGYGTINRVVKRWKNKVRGTDNPNTISIDEIDLKRHFVMAKDYGFNWILTCGSEHYLYQWVDYCQIPFDPKGRDYSFHSLTEAIHVGIKYFGRENITIIEL